MSEDDDYKPLSSIIKSVKKKYDQDKENWKVMGGVDQHGNRDMIISQDPSAFWIKSRPIDPYRSISFGREMNIKSLDDEINAEINKGKFDPKDSFHQLFGMSVPVSDKDLVTAMGIERIAPKEMGVLKRKIDEKYKNTDKNLKKKIRKTWEDQFSDRDKVYM